MKNLAERNKLLAFKLNKLLANEFILSAKVRRAHWNVIGKDFYQKHLFFEMQYKELNEIIDTIAERMRSFCTEVIASAGELVQLSDLKEKTSKKNYSEDFILELVSGHDLILIQIREILTKNVEADDAATTDLLSRLVAMHEKMIWMLRAHLS